MAIPAYPVKDVYAMADLVMPNLDSFDVTGIDEARFFDGTLIAFVNRLVRANKRAIIAGLDTTFAGDLDLALHQARDRWSFRPQQRPSFSRIARDCISSAMISSAFDRGDVTAITDGP